MTIFRGTVLDTPGELGDPAGLRAAEDCALVVHGGVVVARTDPASARATYPDDDVVDLRGGLLVPGLVDTHVHFPQVRIIGGLGMSLLTWLRDRALPEEIRLADAEYARSVARDFLRGLATSGTTTALVFGSHFPQAVDVLFEEAERSGLRVTSGLVLSDRILHAELLQTPETALAAGRDLAERWHGRGRLRYAVTPRFSLSTTEAMLDVCGELLRAGGPGGGRWFTSHVNENVEEVGEVLGLFPGTRHYVDTYDRHGLVTDRSVLAHNVHPTDHELEVLAAAGAAVAHCPSSNAALGSGLFPLRRHLDAGVRVALGSDVGAGTGFCLLKEGLQAYLMQQLLGADGAPLGAADLLHLATRSGATALGLGDEVGDLSVGRQFDAVWVRPRAGGTLEVALRQATDPTDALAKLFTLGSPADVASVWVGGDEVTAAYTPTAGERR
ncbi:MAG TPA: guanine deaminase [Phototrophicaceae bacterium]|nr:guanine deaminase [Phototrophicaceae bacterium]